MRRTLTLLAVLAFAAVLAGGAQAQSVQADTGSADFSRYVALGDSLTAAFWSGGLHQAPQSASYPALIYRQVYETTQGFEQPLVAQPGCPPVLRLVNLSPVTIVPVSPPVNCATLLLNAQLPRPYNNMAVPGADARDVLVTKGGNLFDVVLRGLGFTMLEQALALNPTFATLWIGNNDVLGAATSGIVIEGVTLTSRASFEQDLRTIVGALAGGGVQLAIANIPSVTAIPFVTTIPPIAVAPDGQPFLLDGLPVPLLGPNGFLGPNDRVLLTASPLLARRIGFPAEFCRNGACVRFDNGGVPLPNEVVLDAAEVNAVEARVNELNQVIATVANESGAALVDIRAFFDRVVAEGFTVGGIELSADFLTGGIFSFDGVHPNPVGYAVVANLFIEAINERFDGNIPPAGLQPFLFEGVGLPTVAGQPGPLSAAQAASAVYTPEAYETLRQSLQVPTARELHRILAGGPGGIKPRQPRRPDATRWGRELSGRTRTPDN